MLDTPAPQLLPDNADGIEARAAQIEQRGQIDDRLHIVLRGALKARRIVALIAPHAENTPGTSGQAVEGRFGPSQTRPPAQDATRTAR